MDFQQRKIKQCESYHQCNGVCDTDACLLSLLLRCLFEHVKGQVLGGTSTGDYFDKIA